jgi:hypothetical protein
LNGGLGSAATYFSVGSPAAISTELPARSLRSGLSTDRALEWLNTCLQGHPKCRGHGSGVARLPTRVIDVGDGRNAKPKLFETHSQLGNYVALSYRWGDATIERTLKSNYSASLKAIATQGLCAIYEDAFEVTRKLGYRYIWIDALCIIQDDARDWEREASLMGEVYRNAVLTISASVALSATRGLSVQHQKSWHHIKMPHKEGSGKFKSKWGKLKIGSISRDSSSYFISDRSWVGSDPEIGKESPSGIYDDVVNGILSSRAWCLQERMFSRRILHFGEDQIHWECLETTWDEQDSAIDGDPADDTVGALRVELFSSKLLQDPLAGLAGPSDELKASAYSLWYNIVEHYTRRKLTVSSDKLPAISGVARAFSTYSKDEYAAGIWCGDMLRGLLWASTDFEGDFRPSDPYEGPLTIATPYRAPSWSWASVDGVIRFLRPSEYDTSMTYLQHPENFVSPAGTDPFGQVSEGSKIEVCAWIRPRRGMRGFSQEMVNWMTASRPNLNMDCVPDLAIDDKHANPPGTPLFCVPIVKKKCHPACRHVAGCDKDPMVYALIVKHSPDFEAFVRVGITVVYSSSFEGLELGAFTLI